MIKTRTEKERRKMPESHASSKKDRYTTNVSKEKIPRGPYEDTNYWQVMRKYKRLEPM